MSCIGRPKSLLDPLLDQADAQSDIAVTLEWDGELSDGSQSDLEQLGRRVWVAPQHLRFTEIWQVPGLQVDVRWQATDDGAVVETVPDGIDHVPGRYAFDEKGLDRVVFLLAANVGEDLKPMSKVASGGETSRLMLALKTALAQADRIPTLIFDEIDQGIGGRVGGVVGSKLSALSTAHGADARQVFCVTHLPQLAGYADAHLHVYKTVAEGRTRTVVDALADDARIHELAQMLGGDSERTREMARELLQQGG